jgi:hypothetical protein
MFVLFFLFYWVWQFSTSLYSVWIYGNVINEHEHRRTHRGEQSLEETKDINTTQCTQPIIRRLTANLRTAEAFFRHHYPNLLLQRTSLTCTPHLFHNEKTKQPTDSTPHTQTHDIQQIIYIKCRKTCNGQWGMPMPTGKTQMGSSLRPPHPDQRRRCLENTAQ